MTPLAHALARLAPEFPAFEPGHVWLAGAGPGRLGCLTLEVVAALAAADEVVYDALVDPGALRAAEGAARRALAPRSYIIPALRRLDPAPGHGATTTSGALHSFFDSCLPALHMRKRSFWLVSR